MKQSWQIGGDCGKTNQGKYHEKLFNIELTLSIINILVFHSLSTLQPKQKQEDSLSIMRINQLRYLVPLDCSIFGVVGQENPSYVNLFNSTLQMSHIRGLHLHTSKDQ